MATQREHYEAASVMITELNKDDAAGLLNSVETMQLAHANIALAMVPLSVTEDRSDDYRPD